MKPAKPTNKMTISKAAYERACAERERLEVEHERLIAEHERLFAENKRLVDLSPQELIDLVEMIKEQLG